MAKATVETTEVEVKKVEKVEEVVLRLSKDEARVLKGVLGAIGSLDYDGEVYRTVSSVWGSLGTVVPSINWTRTKGGDKAIINGNWAAYVEDRG